ncbi:hypothetical protein SCHPADRAFT_606742 [Schizopora paradoxa]|uniref:Uncharacterized protein n=1 Tax=Schizopora paradoxa TaxID=27342 RepID=A0A0H2RG44_9AGAM|nr:hypothetical protein SCHPADRAFT_606742 [Schizopora paradoxa]
MLAVRVFARTGKSCSEIPGAHRHVRPPSYNWHPFLPSPRTHILITIAPTSICGFLLSQATTLSRWIATIREENNTERTLSPVIIFERQDQWISALPKNPLGLRLYLPFCPENRPVVQFHLICVRVRNFAWADTIDARRNKSSRISI